MKCLKILFSLCLASGWLIMNAQPADPYKPDSGSPREIPGYKLVWNDEFNYTGKPDTAFWRYETGFVRNQELQWYTTENATVGNGVLLIEGRRERLKNPGYVPGSESYRSAREYAEYTSSSIQTRGKKEWQFGRFEIRARIDTTKGSWPAIWTLGTSGRWPAGGEIDIMEFYRRRGVPIILANVAWARRGGTQWNEQIRVLEHFTAFDPDWVNKFHVWRMDWDSTSIKLYLDNILLNTQIMSEAVNPDGTNPFLQPHYLLLNLAIGAAGGDPSGSPFPIKYEVDYVRVYQREN
jgi:beta-glucanase (GH16 family)